MPKKSKKKLNVRANAESHVEAPTASAEPSAAPEHLASSLWTAHVPPLDPTGVSHTEIVAALQPHETRFRTLYFDAEPDARFTLKLYYKTARDWQIEQVYYVHFARPSSRFPMSLIVNDEPYSNGRVLEIQSQAFPVPISCRLTITQTHGTQGIVAVI